MIDLANDASPDSDPRKILREKTQLLIDMTTDGWRGPMATEHREALTLPARTLVAVLPDDR